MKEVLLRITPTTPTIAMKMLTVQTPKDHSTVLVMLGILEMESFAQV